jgi:hypothetical protein
MSTRHAITFDRDLYSYISKMAAEREESFSAMCASLLREIMKDDMKAEIPIQKG